MKVVTNRYNVPLLNKSTRNTALYAINNGQLHLPPLSEIQ